MPAPALKSRNERDTYLIRPGLLPDGPTVQQLPSQYLVSLANIELLATFSVNAPEHAHRLGPDKFSVKTWSE